MELRPEKKSAAKKAAGLSALLKSAPSGTSQEDNIEKLQAEIDYLKEEIAQQKKVENTEDLQTKPILGYWKMRCLAAPIKYLLAYSGVDFEDKIYEIGDAPEYDKS